MNKLCRLFFCCLLLLTHSLSRSAIPAPGSEITSLATVQSRRQKLSELIAERARLQTVGDQLSLVRVSNDIVELELKLCDLDAALADITEPLEVAHQFTGTSNTTLLVDTLTLSARVHIRRNEIQHALPLLNEALQLSRDLGYRKGEAQAHAQFGAAYYELNKGLEAEASNSHALQIWQGLQEKHGEAQAFAALGEVYVLRDKPAEATAAFKSAETISRSLGDSVQLSNALILQNFLAIRQGQWQAALVLLNEVQDLLVEKAAEPYLAGQMAMSYGEVYEAYGQLETALSYFRESLAYYRDGAHDKRATIDAGNKVGRVQARLGDYAGAKRQIEENLKAALETHNDLNIGLCHEDLGRVWLEAHSYEAARLEFLSAIDYFGRSKSERPLARALIYLGQTEHLLGNLARANEAYEKALPFFQKTPDYTNEAALRFGLGKIALQQGQLAKAEEHLQRSIELTAQLRENAFSKDLRSSFLASVHDRYETYVEWLMTRHAQQRGQGFDIQAFEASEAGRARALLDSLHGYQRELRKPSDPLLLLEEEKLQKEEQRLVDARAKFLSRGGTPKAETEIDAELMQVRGQYESLQARINSSESFKNLLRPTPLSYEDIRSQITDSQTSLLSYSLGAGKSFAWLVTQDGLTSYELSDKQTIEQAATKLIALLKSPAINPVEETQLQGAIDEVSRLVVQPVSEKLRTSRLVIVADGILQYVPFQILKTSSDAKEPLIARFDIVDAPSASALATVRHERSNRKPGAKLLVGFGDAVFSSEYSPQRSKTANANSTGDRSEDVSKLRKLPRLFNAKRELSAIGELAGSDSAFFVEFGATRDNLLKVDLSQYRILHVVTHGVLNADQPELSGLVLSLVDANEKPVDGFVSLADIYKLRAPVDLVVLSACHTALGQEVRGEGLVGLTRGFMYAGASGVVASLWKVDDRATAALMKSFYTNMLQKGLGPAAALRAAQNEIRSQPRWSSPYYWAAFTFQGDYDLSIKPTPAIAVRTYERLIAGGPLVILLAAVSYWVWRRRRTTKKLH